MDGDRLEGERSTLTMRTPPKTKRDAFATMMGDSSGRRTAPVGDRTQCAEGNNKMGPEASVTEVATTATAETRQDVGPAREREWHEFRSQLESLQADVNLNNALMAAHKTTAKAIQAMAAKLVRTVFKLRELVPDSPTDPNGGKECNCSNTAIGQAAAVNKIVSEIRSRVSNELTTEESVGLIKKEWPEQAFVITKAVPVEAILGDVDVRLIVHHSPAAAVNHCNIKRLSSRIIDLPQVMSSDGLFPGTTAEISGSANITIGGTKEERSHRTVVGRPSKMDEQDLFVIIKDMADKLDGVEKIGVITGCGVQRTRKALEIAFANRGVAISICDSIEAKAKHTISAPQSTSVTVTGDGRSYAELLKSVKDSVDIKAAGLKVMSIARRNENDLVIKIKGGNDKAHAFVKALDNNPAASAKVNIKTDIIHIEDLECGVTAADIVDGIRSACPLAEAGDIMVTSIRAAYADTSKATVKIASSVAPEILKKRRIQIGWLNCRVSARKAAHHCFRCWSPDHNVSHCKGPDRRGACYRCGEHGHVKAQCEKTKFCPVCQSSTHSFGNRECPSTGPASKQNASTPHSSV